MESDIGRNSPFEFSFSGALLNEEGDTSIPEFTSESGYRPTPAFVEISERRREIADQIAVEVANFLKGESWRWPKESKRDDLSVEIRFRQGSLLWDGWITVRDALTFSYLQNTVLNDLAVVGGAVAIYEALRRGIGTAIDKVIAEELPNKPSAPYATTRWRPQTRVIAVTPLMSSRQSIPQILNRVDGRLDQVDKRLDQMETNFKAVDQLAAEIQKMRMETRRDSRRMLMLSAFAFLIAIGAVVAVVWK